MDIYVQILNPQSRRVLLQSRFHSHTVHIKKEDVPKVRLAMDEFRAKLEQWVGKGMVQMGIGSFETAAFWSLVFFRPISFPEKAGKTSVYEECLNGRGKDLTESNLGVAYDAENDYLTVFWKEALKEGGILRGIEEYGSAWKRIVDAYEKRTGVGELSANRWDVIARSHPWVVPRWRLRELHYIREYLWHRSGLSRSDLVVFNMTGIELLVADTQERGGVVEEINLMPPLSVKCARPDTSSKEIFRSLQQVHTNIARREKYELERIEGVERRPVYKKRVYNKNWVAASRVVGQLSKLFGASRLAKYPKHMTGDEVQKRFLMAVDNYAFGRVYDVNKKAVERLLDQLVQYCRDPELPCELSYWLHFRGGENFDHAVDYVRHVLLPSLGYAEHSIEE